MAADGPRGESQQHKGCRFGKADCHGKLAAGIAAEPLVIAAYQVYTVSRFKKPVIDRPNGAAPQTDVIPARRSKQYQQHAQHRTRSCMQWAKVKIPTV